MRYGKVIGNVVSTIKNDKMQGIRLAIVEALDPEGNVIGGFEIVGDFLGSAVDSRIIWIEDGDCISGVMGKKNIPLRGSIVAIVDNLDTGRQAEQ
jgi:ethanolamine utilization protein EutN